MLENVRVEVSNCAARVRSSAIVNAGTHWYKNSKDIHPIKANANANSMSSYRTDKILLSLHEFMFRTAIKSANTSTFENVIKTTPEQLVVAGPRQIPVLQTSTVQVYKTEFRYLAGALIIYMIGFLFVTATFWGFWELGRRFSMSPIETAKAFDAPALQGAGTNLPVDELLAVYKKTPLKYGAARAPDGLIKLTLGTSEIEKPVVGSTFH